MQKYFYVGMHVDSLGLILFKIGMMLENTNDLYILRLFEVTLTLSQGGQESKLFCTNYFAKVFIDLDGNWYGVKTWWCGESYSYFF